MFGTALALALLQQDVSSAPANLAGVTIEVKESAVRLLTTYMLLVCGLVMGALAASAEPAEPSAPELPALLTTIGQTQVILRDMQAAEHRIVLEIRHPDVTAMPSRSELRLAFDSPVTEVRKSGANMPLRLDAAIAGQQIALSLARDPFALPQPWSYTMSIAFHRLPQSGVVTLGELQPQRVTFPSTDRVTPAPGT